MEANSPLTGNIVFNPTESYSRDRLVGDWKATFGVDIEDELHGVEQVFKFICPESGLQFFMPKSVQGSDKLYEDLGRFPWYYPSEKWEYSKCLNLLSPKQKVFEVGCGTGRFLEMAKAAGHAAEGLDINKSAVDEARTKGLEAHCAQLDLFSRDRSANYDAVCAFQLLEHLDDPLSFLLDSLRLLKPGGHLILATPNAESFLRYQYTLLDLPPHHMSRWCHRSYQFLESILPVTLETEAFEPLDPVHLSQYARSTAEHISKRFLCGSKMARKVIDRSIHIACQLGLRKFVKGQCMLVVFRKKAEGLASEIDKGKAKRYANLGCGTTLHEDWENYDLVPSSSDVLKMDIVNQWNLPLKAYDAIYSSHVLEHLKRPQAIRFLRNCFNSLKPGGVLRIVVPDLEGICREYLRQLDASRSGDVDAKRRHQWVKNELLDQMVRTSSGGAMGKIWASGDLPEKNYIIDRMGEESEKWIRHFEEKRGSAQIAPDYEEIYSNLHEPSGEKLTRFRDGGETHQWMYDEVSLSSLLTWIGFKSITRCESTDSRIKDFLNYQLDTNESGSTRKPDSLFIECVRP